MLEHPPTLYLLPLPPHPQPAHFAAILFFPPQHPSTGQAWDVTHITRLET